VKTGRRVYSTRLSLYLIKFNIIVKSHLIALFPALSDAVLACEFRTEKDQNPRIEWKKKGKGVTFVYFNDKFTGSYAGRAKIEGATLTIHSVTQKDSGEYRCEVTASEDHVNLGEASVSLNVLVPPHVPSCEVPSSVFVGSGLELLCKDKLSVPPATYRWYKDNKALTATADTPYNIDTNKGTLKFKSVSKLDSGMYRCESSNSVGAPKSCVAKKLKVIDYPLNMTILIAGAAGFLLLILFCCICCALWECKGVSCKRKSNTRCKKEIEKQSFFSHIIKNVIYKR
uniref:Ig-like domain-containing protein n=1 Tax=Anabas testudineus TaxID=64144 RepID=A0A3Q1I8H3_ANATE